MQALAACAVLRPMTMETRCSKVFFPNYSEKKPAGDTLVPPLWRKQEKKIFFLQDYLFTLLFAAALALSR